MTELEPKKERKWYQKKRYIISAIFAMVFILASSTSGINNPQNSNISPVQKSYSSITAPVTNNTNSQSNLSNDNYYTNIRGNTVHSPSYTTNNSIPYGASAQCRDGSYSFSQHRQGTCSHHGGVSNWLE